MTIKRRLKEPLFNFDEMFWTVAFIFLVSTSLVSSKSGQCQPGSKEVFMLATNTGLNEHSYEEFNTNNISECVTRCQNDVKCHSLTYYHNITSAHCRLLENTASNARHVGLSSDKLLLNGTYYFEKICLKHACDRLFVLEWLNGASLEGYNDKSVVNISQQQCLDLCMSDTDFVCRSAEYNELTNECRLSRHDRFSRPTAFKKDEPHVHYFDNSCAYKPVNGGKLTEIMLLGNVQHPYSLSEYYGLTVSECGDMCLKNSLFPCRSFLFGRKSERPYCGLTHQNRAALMHNPGSFEPSQNLNYYEIARSLDGCDTSDIHFELLSGTALDTVPYKVVRDQQPQECLKICRHDENCRSVNVDYRKGTCEFNAESTRSSGLERNLKENPNVNHYEKVCLNVANSCSRDWAFERIRGKELTGISHEKVYVEASTREECETACLEYSEFVCRSAEFNYQMNECRLSPYSRFSATDKRLTLSTSRAVVDYLENNCAHEARGFCNWKSAKQHRFILADRILSTKTVSDCKTECVNNTNFICRSFTYDTGSKTCALSHHSRRSAPPSTLVRSPFERKSKRKPL